jgi:hypothetical protein
LAWAKSDNSFAKLGVLRALNTCSAVCFSIWLTAVSMASIALAWFNGSLFKDDTGPDQDPTGALITAQRLRTVVCL